MDRIEWEGQGSKKAEKPLEGYRAQSEYDAHRR